MSGRIDFPSQLNTQQLRAVQHVEGPVLILAGAGSGKTRTITYKIAYLIDKQHSRPDQILAVTFTNKAAAEMRERVEQLLQHLSIPPLVSTFHSFGVRVLRRQADRIGYSPNFTICDTDDQRRILKQIYKELGLKDEYLPLAKTHSVISHAKNQGWSPDEYLKNSRDFDSESIHRAFTRYSEYLKKSDAADFDDLILLTVQLLREHEDIRNWFCDRYRYILVDEYQDTNAPQYELVKLLTTKHQNISAVGDEDQSIYGFRGADITNILRFEKDFSGAKVIKLEQNYRSTQNILDAATSVVSNNLSRNEKVLWTSKQAGERITLHAADDAREEAFFVAQKVRQHLDSGVVGIAVLYRTNFQSRQFEEVFRRLSIPYRLVGGVSFYHRKEVRDALAYLRVARNPEDNVSLERILNEPPRGIGQVTRDKLRQLADEKSLSLWGALQYSLRENLFPARAHLALKTFAELVSVFQEALDLPLYLALEMILDKSGYMEIFRKEDSESSENRVLNIQELITVARDYSEGEGSIQSFLDQAALYADIDEFDSSADITLMTLHNAKGLEFPVVFLAGCEEGLFPHSRAIDENDLEEERRLCYVGLTRAQKKLYLSYCRRRRFFGRETDELNQPSRFLSEIPAKLLETAWGQNGQMVLNRSNQPSILSSQALRSPAKPKRVYTGRTYNSVESVKAALGARVGRTGFVSGALVTHGKFGKGKILKVEDTGTDLKITVQFPGLGIKKLLQSFAKLKLI
jgi:DNA helicase-2/ATP-dependent DNA helicase PcrA